MKTKALVAPWRCLVLAAGLSAACRAAAAPDIYQPGAAPDVPDVGKLPQYVVAEAPLKAYLFPWEITLLNMFQWGDSYYDYGPFNTWRSGSFVATPLRIPQHPKNSAFTASVESGKKLQGESSEALAGALASDPEFALSGRGVGLKADLRGISAQVLLDGVPYGDPFSRSVAWADAPREGLARAESVPGGGATAWGDGALGGVVQLFTVPPSGELVTKPGALFGGGPPDPTLTKQVVVGTGQIAAFFGGFDTRSLEFAASQPTVEGTLQMMGGMSASDGTPIVSSTQRGSVDVAAWSRNEWLETRWRRPLGKDLVLTATLRGRDDSIGEGTAYQQASALARFASVALSGHPSKDVAWNAVAYAQDGDSADTFSSVNAARTIETPVLDQVGQPASAYGASLSGEWWQADGSSTSAAVDLRHARGETRDDFAFAGGLFTRGLAAGGEQDNMGAFVLRDQQITSTFRIVLGARIDGWNEKDGHQEETDLGSGSVLARESYGGASGTELSPSLGLVWRPTVNWRLHANSQQAFSTPALSDLYQPYGQDSVVTEANPLLRTEHNTSFEAGAEYTVQVGQAPPKPDPYSPARRPHVETLILGVTAFSNNLHDAIGDMPLAPASGPFPIFGELPAGYVAQQRINLDHSLIQGATVTASWIPASTFWLDAAVVFNDATIRSVAAAPGLDGREVAGIPRRSAVVRATWQASRKVTLTSRIRVLGPQFVDDENSLRLAESVVVDLRAAYTLTGHSEIFATAENLTNARIETSRGADGITYVGRPCTVLGGVRFSW